VSDSNENTLNLRRSFVFAGVDFYEDPCECHTVLYAFSGSGKDGPLSRPLMIVGPVALVQSIKTVLQNAKG
jgi:hypothetical protein